MHAPGVQAVVPTVVIPSLPLRFSPCQAPFHRAIECRAWAEHGTRARREAERASGRCGAKCYIPVVYPLDSCLLSLDGRPHLRTHPNGFARRCASGVRTPLPFAQPRVAERSRLDPARRQAPV